MTIEYCATIIEAIRGVMKRMLTHTRAELEYQIYVVRAPMRSHVEED